MNAETHRVSIKFDCGHGHLHDMCVSVNRGVPPELRCPDEQPAGWSVGGGGCRVPEDLASKVDRELRDNLQECKRRGFVLIAA